MAESFLFVIAERVLEKIAFLVVKEVLLVVNVKSDLEKLRETMSTIKPMLLDADRRQQRRRQQQQQQQNENLCHCIWKLRDVFYDAEDLLDEFECDALQKEVLKRPSTGIKVRCLASCCTIPLSFSSKMGHKIKKINERLVKFATELNGYDLVRQDDNPRVIHRETYSFVNSSDVVGRDEDKENIINLLMKPGEGRNIPVIPLVGIGGLGKTTLAKFVYNDKRVIGHFPLRIWVCVSEEFDLTILLKAIIYSINKDTCEGVTIDALQTKLRDLLNGKKFLLVLDDVWNVDRVNWIELRDLLMSSDNSSQNKIIMTTRFLEVASVMNPTDHPYQLKGLPHKDCMSLFAKWAFDDGDERRYPNLMEIGVEIVEKCKGVPLAVRTLGSLLFLKRDVREWMFVKDNEIWRHKQTENDIIPALKLSYYHLPSYLQRCLAYLSLYKKDTIYESSEVVQFWMANGLLEHPMETEEWEDVGIRYVNELWSRCFIQEVSDHGSYWTFKLHDLIHDLALDVSQKECKIVSSQTTGVDEGVRHLSFPDDQPRKTSDLQFLKRQKKVRTIVGQGGSFVDEFDFIKFCISHFNYLRVLRLWSLKLEVLPDSITTLKQLRCLDLRGSVHLRNLPSSFYKLQSLLILNIGSVELEQWDDSLQSLSRLRYLELTFNATNHWGQRIRPGCWSSLQYLCLYYCRSKFLFEGVQYLTSLRTLCLFMCRGASSLSRNLTLLTKLEHLQIEWFAKMNLLMEPAVEEDRHLHLNLKTFSVGFSHFSKELPQLLLEGSARTLQFLKVEDCKALERLPEWLQNLTSLQKLEISSCPRLSSLPEGMDRLAALRELKIKGCPMLTERCQREGGADWPKIAHVREVNIEDIEDSEDIGESEN